MVPYLTVLIAGLIPREKWAANPGGERRTVEEAVGVAERQGLTIPDDVAFFMDEDGELDETITARGPRVTKLSGEPVGWVDLVHDLTGKVPLIVRPDVFDSDEAVVAVFTHELFEINALRRILGSGRTITVEEFVGYCGPENPGNLHDEAWDAADEAVRRMRKGKGR